MVHISVTHHQLSVLEHLPDNFPSLHTGCGILWCGNSQFKSAVLATLPPSFLCTCFLSEPGKQKTLDLEETLLTTKTSMCCQYYCHNKSKTQHGTTVPATLPNKTRTSNQTTCSKTAHSGMQILLSLSDFKTQHDKSFLI